MRAVAVGALAAAVAVAGLSVGSAGAAAPTTVRVSVNAAGVQGGARSWSFGGVVSDGGRFVAFTSTAAHLGVLPDRNGVEDVYLRDVGQGTTRRVSWTWNGRGANGASTVVAISADGRDVLFTSVATNLVPVPGLTGEGGPQTGVFLRDMTSGTIRRVSVSTTGAQANRNSAAFGLSANGRVVLFGSWATNLAPRCPRQVFAMYVRVRGRGRTVRVSPGCLDVAGDAAAISASGRYVAFASAGLPACTQRLYLRDRATGGLRVVPTPRGLHVAPAAVSADGRFVTYTAYRSHRSGAGCTGEYDFQVYRRDRLASRTTLVSETPGGSAGNGASRAWGASAGGREIVFGSDATDLVAGDTNGAEDALLADMRTGRITRVSLSYTGAQLARGATQGGISPDGRWAVFSSDDTHVVAGADMNGEASDVFLRGPSGPP